MKYFILIISLMIVGCSQHPPPQSNLAQDWSEFGKQTAIRGSIIQSENKLAKADESGQLNDELYLSYRNGYEEGRQEYCSQSAYMLGVKGKPYLGICNDLDPFYNQDYISGRTSTAGSM